MKRCIFTVALGKPKYAEMAMGLGRSLAFIGDATPRVVYTDLGDKYDWGRYFDQVVAPPEPRSALDKLRALDLTEYDQILSLDGDCLAFKRLEPAFEALQGSPLAVLGDYQREGTWHGADVAEMCRRLNVPQLPRFNGGLIYYERTPAAQRLISRAREIERDYGSTGFENFRGNASEEVCVAMAMLETGIGDVAPDELDFMNTATGIVGRLTLDVLKNECHFVCRRQTTRYVEPYVFHAARFVNYFVYWRQLDRLKALEKGR
ncbi:MAG: hypothetical protein ACO1SV_02755 [Fimbriimonas sp.]